MTWVPRREWGYPQGGSNYAMMLSMIMEAEKRYVEQIKEVIHRFDPQGSNKYFLFGSSVRKEKFHDIDLGVMGNALSQQKLSELRDYFYDSNIPFKVDVVDFDTADESFREYVLHNEPIVWIH
jgi:predicted nucleotidyltransferase